MRLVVFVALLLAGCQTQVKDGQVEPVIVTNPNDFSQLQNSTGGHVHDYWEGRDRVVVLETTRPESCVTYSGEEAPQGSFRPAEGDIVPQGTGRLDIVLVWTESTSALPEATGLSSKYTHMELYVKTAKDASPTPTNPPTVIENGRTLQLNSTNALDDPPHYVLSLWEFEPVAINQGGRETTFCGTFSIQVIAFRTLPLEIYPPHPDPWRGAHELPLVDWDEGETIHVGAGLTKTSVGGYAELVIRPEAGAVIPVNASWVHIILQSSSASGPFPLSLQAHGADTWTFHDFEPTTNTNGLQVFQIPLAEGTRGDSPYATQSLWEFRIYPTNPQEIGIWTGSWSLSAKALREP